MPDYRSRQERRQSQEKNKNNNKGKGNKKGLFKKILLAVCIFVGLCIIGGGVAVYAIIKNAPPLNPALLSTPMSSVIYDKDGNKVTSVFDKHNRLKVDINKVPPLMKKAVVSIEDRRFYQHFGIDPRRIIGAAISDITKGRLAEGASTIDQQVVKRDFLSPKKTFVRKIQGAWLAIELDRHYTKDQILQMYLNTIYYGHGAYGIKTASETYFGQSDLSKLNLSQMALLAGLPNLPSADDPFTHPKNAKERRDAVLQAMVENGVISKDQAQKAEAKSISSLLTKKPTTADKGQTPYYGAFIDVVYDELVNKKKIITKDQFSQGGLKIYTTYDPTAQKKVYDLQHSDELDYPDKYFNSGIALIDTQSGAIRAIGGGRNYTSFQSGINYATVKTDIGSTAKPIADYGPAIEYLKWSTYHPLEDKPYKWPGTNNSLHDWDNKYRGKMTARDALAYSRNIPAAETFFAVGKDKAAQFAASLGIKVDKPVPGTFSIGSFKPGASPLQMAGAYAAFGDQGVYHKPYAVKKIVFPNGKTITLHDKPQVVMHDYTAYMTTDMLKSVIDYGTASSLGRSLPSNLPVAGKTGSVGLPQQYIDKGHVTYSRPLSDEWFVGYTPQYTMAVWTGYSSKVHNGKVYYVKGGQHSERIAMETFGKVISAISSDHVSDWKMPDSVVQVKLEKDTGLLASDNTPSKDVVNALFVKGTQPTKVSTKYQKPDTPTNLQGTYDDKKQSITLKWDYPKDKKGVQFAISYSVDGGQMQQLTTTDQQQITLNNASPGSTYTFQVVATIGKNNSDPATTTVTTQGANLQPPSGVNAKYDKKHMLIVVSWKADPGQNVSYQITYSVDGGQPQVLGTTDQTQAVINSPNPGSTYTISVVAVEGNQTSDPASASVQVPPSSTPTNGGTDNTGNTGSTGSTDTSGSSGNSSGSTDSSGGSGGSTTSTNGSNDGSSSTQN